MVSPASLGQERKGELRASRAPLLCSIPFFPSYVAWVAAAVCVFLLVLRSVKLRESVCVRRLPGLQHLLPLVLIEEQG